MTYRVKLSDLANMPRREAERILDELVRAAKLPQNGQRAVLNARIQAFELRYEMTSDEMRERLRAGRLEETDEIAQWLFLLSARDQSAGG